MKIIFVVLSFCVVYLQALKCQIGDKKSSEIRQALSMCVKNNETLEKVWEMTVDSSGSLEENSGTQSLEEKNEQPMVPDSKSDKKRRSRRATNKNYSMEKETEKSDAAESDSNNRSEETNPLNNDTSETCIIQCVLNQIGLVDANGLPDHSKLVDTLTKDAPTRELRNFLQDSIDECYQEVNSEENIDHCLFANKLVKCMADKGKSNCSDWAAGSLPF